MARKLFDEKTALWSLFFLTVDYLHVRDSHYIYTDVWNPAEVLRIMLAEQVGVLGGDSAFTVRIRAVQERSDIHR